MRCAIAVALAFALAGGWGAVAAEPEDQYLSICGVIREADNLMPLARESEALPKYTEAKAALEKLQQEFPEWNAELVHLRLGYLTNRVSKLVSMAVKPAPSPAVKTPANPPPLDWELQLISLRQEIRQLQSDRSLLEAKLREALSVLPSPSDPREQERLQARLEVLERENALLRATVGQMRLQLSSASAFSALPPPTVGTNIEFLQQVEEERLQAVTQPGRAKTNAPAGRKQAIVKVAPGP